MCNKRLKLFQDHNLYKIVPSDLTCDSLPDLPFGLAGGTGQLIEDKKTGQLIPVICGGYDGSQERCDCFSFETGKWNPIGSLNRCRRYSSSIVTGSNYLNPFHVIQTVTEITKQFDILFLFKNDR